MRSFFFFVLFFFCVAVHAQQIAFPTAEGMGKFTTGGRGTPSVATTVMEVTNLNDDNLPGSFRYAVTKSGIASRTVVFRVSGTIHLTSKISLSRPNTTIAGQSAPGDGICIADYPVMISADNLIIRYIRFRMGDKNQNQGMVNGSGGDDAFGGTGHKNIIIDHCTMSWSNDEAFSIYGGDSTTLQWNVISEPLNYSYHFETGDADFEHHGYGGIWGGKHTTAHHNLIAHVQGRAPRFDGSRNLGDGATTGLENVDFRNNVIYDWGSYNVNGGEGGNYNIVNNYYKYGLSTSNSSSTRGMIINPGKAAPLPYGKYYLSGNYVDGSTLRTNNNWSGAVMNGGTASDTTLAKVYVPFLLMNINTETALNAYQSVLKNAGCVLPNRDTLDARIVNDVINRTGKVIDVQGNYPAHSTNTPAGFAATVNAWPTLSTAPAPTDTDHDGMPDEWETQRGLNSANAADRNGYNSNGYTNIENYLNGDSIVAFGKVNDCVATKQTFLTGSSTWVDAKDTTYTRLISTDTNNVAVSLYDNSPIGLVNIFYYTTSVIRYDLLDRPYLNKDFTILPSTPLTAPMKVRVYFTAEEFNALKAVDPSIVSIADLEVLKLDESFCYSYLAGDPQVIVPSSYGVYGTYKTGYYLEFSIASSGGFFIASKALFPVPVKLVSFNAVQNNGQVKTNWSTNNEIDTKGYIVERSADNRTFTQIGVIAAANSTLTNNYHFTDVKPIEGISYYRLKMLDQNGQFTYSKIIAIDYKKRNNVFTINPNPVKNVLNISFPEQKTNGVLNIIGGDGKKLVSLKINANTGNQLLDVSFLKKGIYAAVFVFDNTYETTKFIKN